jgi:hypothetical protein
MLLLTGNRYSVYLAYQTKGDLPMTLKFSPANAKIEALAKVKALLPYLANGRKVFSFDTLSGVNCPYAKDCHSKAVVGADGRRHIEDGPHTQFRCFSASQEVLFTGVYNLRKNNGDIILPMAAQPFGDVIAGKQIVSELPKKAGIIRIHVGGDFKTQNYFDAWCYAARERPDVLFYAYTKSLPFWVKRLGNILTASRGGYKDELIDKYNLREAVVVFTKASAKKAKLPIDHDDSHAANPKSKNKSFALLIHGVQPKGSEAAKALRALNGEGSYSK